MKNIEDKTDSEVLYRVGVQVQSEAAPAAPSERSHQPALADLPQLPGGGDVRWGGAGRGSPGQVAETGLGEQEEGDPLQFTEYVISNSELLTSYVRTW